MPFVKGKSGNPGGRPKELQGIQSLARIHAPAAIKVLADVAANGQSEAARVSAAVALLDRGFGRPAQTIDATVTKVDPNSISDAELVAHLTGDGSQDTAAAEIDPSKLN